MATLSRPITQVSAFPEAEVEQSNMSVETAVRDEVRTRRALGVWLVTTDRTTDLDGWRQFLADAGESVGLSLSLSGSLEAESPAAESLRPGAGDVLLFAADAPSDACLDRLSRLGKGIVILNPEARGLLTCTPSTLVPESPSPEVVGMAVLAAEAAAVREAVLREETSRLRQRLDDRILLERAKGVLVARLRLSEEEAYRRIRGTARRQRRSLAETARSILDADGVLDHPETTNDSEAGGVS